VGKVLHNATRSQDGQARTAALREALGTVNVQLEELRGEHTVLAGAHRALLSKELGQAGLLRDRYVAGLFARLSAAEARLAVAGRRAAAWGFPTLVPAGTVDRGIQTLTAEVWAGGGSCGLNVLRERCSDAGVRCGADMAAPVLAEGITSCCEGSSCVLLPCRLSDPCPGMMMMTATAGRFRDGAEGDVGGVAKAPADKPVQRQPPAFAQHGRKTPASADLADGRADCAESVSDGRHGGAERPSAADAPSPSPPLQQQQQQLRLNTRAKRRPAAFDPALVLLPECIHALLNTLVAWPGMAALLRWVAAGNWMSGLCDGDLGHPLHDVQVWK
jgi:hypothetical protein